MRFLESGIMDTNLASAGTIGRYSVEELQRKFTFDRQRTVVQRSQRLFEEVVKEEEEEKDASVSEHDSESDSDAGSEGEFQPDSEDEEMAATVQKQAVEESLEGTGVTDSAMANGDDGVPTTMPSAPTTTATIEQVASVEESGDLSPLAKDAEKPNDVQEQVSLVYRQETTRSLAFRLLDVDVGYSSDEAGDEDCAYFIDGVDATFSRAKDVVGRAQPTKTKFKPGGAVATIPARQNEFAALGERARLVAAVALTLTPPIVEDFDRFPYSSTKELDALERVQKEARAALSPAKTNRSTTKVAQISVATGDILHVWANVESAAATLQLPINQLKHILTGEYDDEFGDEVGGYKWQYALAGAKVTAGTGTSGRGGGGKKAKEAWLEFRDKLYDPAEPHLYKNSNRLRDYQVDGVNWLASTWYKRQGCILADEMGCKYRRCIPSQRMRSTRYNADFLTILSLFDVVGKVRMCRLLVAR
jgi:hypothetical protein